jgi:putative transposase
VTVFEDEASLSNTATVSYDWSEKGRQPTVCQPQRKKERKTIFGCVCPETGTLVADVADKGNTITFFKFVMKAVKAFDGKKLYMVLDNVRFHHAKRLKPILERYKHRIELIFLPPYSPDLNPVERVWRLLSGAEVWLMRKNVTHNRWVQSMEKRIDNFNKWVDNCSPEQIKRVCNLFEIIY